MNYWTLATCFPITELVRCAVVVAHSVLGYFRIFKAKERRWKMKTQMLHLALPLPPKSELVNGYDKILGHKHRTETRKDTGAHASCHLPNPVSRDRH